jgi:hypothetical protein
MCDTDRYMVLNADSYPPDEGTELFAFLTEAKVEADKRNRTRPNEAQGELTL